MAALWSGVTPTIARNGIQQATMFYFKAVIDAKVRRRGGDYIYVRLGWINFYAPWCIWCQVWGKDARDPDKKLEVWQSMTSGLLASCPGM